ncbi:FAD binding domain protein [uncultured Desulfatiglans sp.]|uniref:FAD binding domain protein n=1 Tax=Uncultured Desulfatiglans sp. TaxID=1748965 RepID=A0A653A584_UNCDX|nr:FAD binding domain protein [uncultured Desulfatiglans sp.]
MESFLQSGKWVTDPDIVEGYRHDALGMQGGFEALFRPEDTADIQECLRMISDRGGSVTCQGLRSSLTGASMAPGGVALSLERFNRILDIDRVRRRALVEPGVVLAELKAAAAADGLFYPPDPTSAAECTLGGNVATNASGSRSLKYGATIEWVRALQVVDGSGRVITARTAEGGKICAGYGAFYDPARLFVGSEGTLGVVTRIEVALTELPEAFMLVLVFFPDMSSALDFVIRAREDPACDPRSLEFLDEGCLEIIRGRAEGLDIPTSARVIVYFEQEYGAEDGYEALLDAWSRLIEQHTPLAGDTRIALTDQQKDHIMALRHFVPESMNALSIQAVRTGGCKISTDWAVPYRRLPELFAFFEEVRARLGSMPVVRFAHIGEGHPHFNFIARDPEEKRRAEEVDLLMARRAVALGGTITGEHGVGKMKREHLALQYPPAVITAMKAIKRSFDPKGILAPGNIFPADEGP